MIREILKTLAVTIIFGIAMFVSLFVTGALFETGPSILGAAVNMVNSFCVGWSTASICVNIAFGFKPGRRAA